MNVDDKIKYAKTRIEELELLIKHWEKEKSRQDEKNKVEQNIHKCIQMSISKSKVKAQVKSRWYYYFWGSATVAVVAGQFYVGNGFRRMADSIDKLLDVPVMITVPNFLYDYPIINDEPRAYREYNTPVIPETGGN